MSNAVPQRATSTFLADALVDDKDLRRRGVELEMAHKAHDRARGKFHSRKGRSSCTLCNGGHPRSARGAPAVTKRDSAAAELEARESSSSSDDYGEWDDAYDGHVTSGVAHRCSEECQHIMGARVVVRSLRKRKGIASDYEFIPSVTSGVRTLVDEHFETPASVDDWEHVSAKDYIAQRSYSAVVQS